MRLHLIHVDGRDVQLREVLSYLENFGDAWEITLVLNDPVGLHGEQAVRQRLAQEELGEVVDVLLAVLIELCLEQDRVEDREQVGGLANEVVEGVDSNGAQLREIYLDALVKEWVRHHLCIIIEVPLIWIGKDLLPIIALFQLLDQIEIVENRLLVVSIRVQPFKIENDLRAQVILAGDQIGQLCFEGGLEHLEVVPEQLIVVVPGGEQVLLVVKPVLGGARRVALQVGGGACVASRSTCTGEFAEERYKLAVASSSVYASRLSASIALMISWWLHHFVIRCR